MPERESRFGPGAARPDGEFVGRSAELGLLREISAMLADGMPASLLVGGMPGVGKSELLRQAAACLHDERRGLVTAYLAPEAGDPATVLAGLAGDLVRAVFPPPREGAAGDPAREREWAGSIRGPVGDLLRLMPGPPGEGPDAWRALARLAGVIARERELRLLVFLDDAQLLPGAAAAVGAAAGPVSWVLAADGPPPSAGSSSIAPRRLILEPLDEALGGELLAISMRRAGVSLARECLPAAGLLGGIPLLLWQAAGAARLRGIRVFEDRDAFLRFYAAEATEGFLSAALRDRITGGAGGDRAREALDILRDLAARTAPVERVALARDLRRDEASVARALEGLASRGLVTDEWGGITAAMPAPLADVCRVEARRLEGCSVEESRTRLFLERRAALDRTAAEGPARRNIGELRAFLTAWKGQAVPRSLFDAERFGELFVGGCAGRDVLAAADRSRLTLPEVAETWSENFPGAGPLSPYRLDLLALALPGKDGRERWVAVDVRLGDTEVTSDAVLDFERRLRAFQARSGARAGQVSAWMISGGGFSAEAREAARKFHCWSSGPDQLRLLAELVRPEGALQLVVAAPAPAEESYALQLVIPARAEIELVAARALEQLGESLPLGPGDLGKVKMALVEACLNAFEHGRSEDKTVTLTFRVRPACLEVEVFNRGASFAPASIVKPRVEEKIGAAYKRGWGLSLIRDLMDEMEFAQREGGTLLKMTKYFQPKTGGSA